MLVLFGSETYAKHHSAVTLFILFLTPPSLSQAQLDLLGWEKASARHDNSGQVLSSSNWPNHIWILGYPSEKKDI